MNSVYKATQFGLGIWSKLNDRFEANGWQHPDWVNKPEGIYPLYKPDVEPDNMDANPYRRYCKEHHLTLGTVIPPVTKQAYNAAVLLIAVMEPLKHLMGSFEAAARIPISLGLQILYHARIGL
ncbi:MAG: hypothetical protein LW832_08300 [Parachlamydia sp.]|jgi:hypothetical protein|nr:hypothetical protein [Parachlamydia sp.]